MPLFDEIKNKAPVLAAIAEYRSLGAVAFLKKHQFGPAREYWLMHDGEAYASKAILGVAIGYARGTVRRQRRFSGGTIVKRKLEQLGFKVVRGKQPAGVEREIGNRPLEKAATAAATILRKLASADHRFSASLEFRPGPSKTVTDGHYVECGYLRIGRNRYSLQISLERYPRSTARDFWYGVYTSAKGAGKSLLDHFIIAEGKPRKHLRESDTRVVDKTRGLYELKTPFSMGDWSQTISELYSEEFYIGQYRRADSCSSATVAQEAVAFWTLVAKAAVLDEKILEGVDSTASRTSKSRSMKLRRAAIDEYAKNGKLTCRGCDFSAPARTPNLSVIEFHHTKPLASFGAKGLSKAISLAVKSLMPLCPTCHRLVHKRSTAPLTLVELKQAREKLERMSSTK